MPKYQLPITFTTEPGKTMLAHAMRPFASAKTFNALPDEQKPQAYLEVHKVISYLNGHEQCPISFLEKRSLRKAFVVPSSHPQNTCGKPVICMNPLDFFKHDFIDTFIHEVWHTKHYIAIDGGETNATPEEVEVWKHNSENYKRGVVFAYGTYLGQHIEKDANSAPRAIIKQCRVKLSVMKRLAITFDKIAEKVLRLPQFKDPRKQLIAGAIVSVVAVLVFPKASGFSLSLGLTAVLDYVMPTIQEHGLKGIFSKRSASSGEPNKPNIEHEHEAQHAQAQNISNNKLIEEIAQINRESAQTTPEQVRAVMSALIASRQGTPQSMIEEVL